MRNCRTAPQMWRVVAFALMFFWSSGAFAQCRPDWDPNITIHIQQLLAVLGNTTAKANKISSLARCTDEAARGVSIANALKDQKAKTLIVPLLRQVADIQRNAYTRLAANGDRESASKYLQREIDFRHWYLNELVNIPDGFTANDDLKKLYPETMHYLAEAYELQGRGQPMSDLLVSADAKALWPTTFNIWARGLASCHAWNFKDGANFTDKQLKDNVCSSLCKPAVKLARQKIEGKQIQEGEFQRVWPRILGALKQCSA